MNDNNLSKLDIVTVIVLNWNGIEDTRRCLDSLLSIKCPEFKIIVIDNGSMGDQAKILKKEFKNKVEVHKLDKNIGFTGGCNYGIQIARKNGSKYYLLLNNDTEVNNSLLYLIEAAKSDSQIGIVGPLIRDYFSRDRILFSGGGFNWLLAKTFHKSDNPTSLRYEEFITGCCFLIKEELLNRVGLLDNRFFAYFEDAAYCVSAKREGYRLVCEPRAYIYHKEAASSKIDSDFSTYLKSRNRILFVNNYTNSLYKIYFSVFNFFKLIIVIIYFVMNKNTNRAQAFIKGYIDGIREFGGEPRL